MNSAVAAQLWASPEMHTGPPMVISEKKILKRCCVSVIFRHDLLVAVMYLSHGYSTGGPWSCSTINKNHCTMAQEHTWKMLH